MAPNAPVSSHPVMHAAPKSAAYKEVRVRIKDRNTRVFHRLRPDG
jgi:hypothetical protein